MKARTLPALIGAALVFLSGCGSNPTATQALIYMVAVQQGTSRFIEHKDTESERSARAAEVIRVVGVLKATTATGDDATVWTLQEQALAIIKAAGLDQSDEALANTVVAAVGEALRDRINAGVLNPQDRIRVATVLDQIAAAARVYLDDPQAAVIALGLRDLILADIDARFPRASGV
jgi:hypothetical protein